MKYYVVYLKEFLEFMNKHYFTSSNAFFVDIIFLIIYNRIVVYWEVINMKKGFTLIELLAVIIILGIVALIAVPTITKVLDDSKKKATDESARQYINAVNRKIQLTNMENSSKKFADGLYSLPLNSELEPNINGKKPIGGWIKVEDGKVKEYSIIYDDYTVTVDENGNKTIGKTNSKKSDTSKSNTEANSNTNKNVTVYSRSLKKINVGDKINLSKLPDDYSYAIQDLVKGDLNDQFYLKHVFDSTGELIYSKVCLISDKELCLEPGDYEKAKKEITNFYGYNSTWRKSENTYINTSNNEYRCELNSNSSLCGLYINNAEYGLTYYLVAYAKKDGSVSVLGEHEDYGCTIKLDGTAYCFEQ